MRRVTNTRLLALAFAASALGLANTVMSGPMLAQTTPYAFEKTIDDGQDGYASNGFVRVKHDPAYGGYASYSKNATATWKFAGLGAGTYDVYATWAPTAGFGEAAYIVSSPVSQSTKTVVQNQPPKTMTYKKYKWESIAKVTAPAGGTITVSVKTAGTAYAQADAVMVVSTDGSPATSPAVAGCGNGVREGDEQCDDGNQTQNDTCTNACTVPRCGDGVWQVNAFPTEACDDGNQSNADNCTNDCKLAKCGDGHVNGTEQCDNGMVGGPSCGPTCKFTVCGDKKVEGLEYCDDGNANSGDGCSAQCVTEAPAGSDTQSIVSAVLSCENGTSYATVRYTKNHANCVYLKKNGQEFMYNYQSFCDGPLNAVATAKMELKENIVVQPGDKLRACHPMIVDVWGCTGDVTVTGASCAPTPPVCGNGKKEGTEECDDGNQSNTDNCTNACKNQRCGDGFHNPGLEFCDDGNQDNNDACSNRCEVQRCGDGKLQQNTGEECDDGYQDNTDACTSLCKVAKCGDGFVKKPSSNMSYSGYEQCDDGNAVSGDGCSAQCMFEAAPVCGNGKKEGTEQCDDGNAVNGDGCSPTCQTQAITVGCGNGKIDAGEICDNGTNNVSFLTTQYGYCTTLCRPSGLSICGNGTMQGTEQCDDGNSIDNDACRNNCMLPTACGNGKKEGSEQCDDGNRNDNDACTNACNNAKCMDGIVWTNVEGCDDGNNVNSDACTNACMPKAVCGNGVQDIGEQCDDGNRVDTDACKNDCTKPASTNPTPIPEIPASCGNWIVDAGEQCEGFGGVRTPLPGNTAFCCTAACRVEACGPTAPAQTCGNGAREGTEQCDDGNRVDTDACRNNCTNNAVTAPRCGDGIVNQANEQCDDGNQSNADACSNACTLPAPTAPLTIRNVDMGAAPNGLVTKGSVPALRFTATAGAQNAVINGLRFTAREGNIARGVFAVLMEKQTGDAAGAFYPGRYWYAKAPSELGQAAFVFSEPITVLAGTTKTFEVELYMNCCNDWGGDYEPYNYTPVENTPVGPVRIDFDTASPNYVTASRIVNGGPTPLSNIATNGACASGNCGIAVQTGPTRTVDVRHAGNLTVTGEGGAASAQVAAGTESPVLLRMKLRMSNHEDGRLDILPFSVQGAQAVESLTITVDGRTVTPATPRDCGYLAPYSAYEQSVQGNPSDPVNHGLGGWYYQWLGIGNAAPANQFCTFFDSSRGSEILPRDKDVIVEVRAKIKPRSSQWTSGTKIKVSLIQNEHYLYALGETSGTPLRPKNPATTGGNVTYAGTLSSNEMTAQ